MKSIGHAELADYPSASRLEWIEANGVGGLAASSVVGANTRKQHAVLSIDNEYGGRTVLVASLQESILYEGRTYDLSTNAYFGAISPKSYEHLESFSADPWPTWRYRFHDIVIEKTLCLIYGENTVIVRYRLLEAGAPAVLTVRPLMAFRSDDIVCSEHVRAGHNWHVTSEFIECMPEEGAQALYIAHPNAHVETIGLWYRGFVYERDRESHVDCIEDLYQPGYLEMTLGKDKPCTLIFSTPSPRSVELADAYEDSERRRRLTSDISNMSDDAFFGSVMKSAASFVYDDAEGLTSILPGLPWGEGETYRSLIAFPGALLVPKRFDLARKYLSGICELWSQAEHPSRFANDTAQGQMHRADVPLWVFVAAWRYWAATQDRAFVCDVVEPVLQAIARYYMSDGEVHFKDTGLVEVGYESHANYPPLLPLGTNALWYNAQMILAQLAQLRGNNEGQAWRQQAQQTREQLVRVFQCDGRRGLADAVYLNPLMKDESVRLSQVLVLGLPFCVLDDPRPTGDLIEYYLATPYGPRTLSISDNRYVGDGTDVSQLPKIWSGSVDPAWFGYWCDALKRMDYSIGRDVFGPFESRLCERGIGHISGAYAGNPPHTAHDYVASSSAAAEIVRIYAREILQWPHVI